MPTFYRGQYLIFYKPSKTWKPKLPMIPQKGIKKGRFIIINELRTKDDKRSRRSSKLKRSDVSEEAAGSHRG